MADVLPVRKELWPSAETIRLIRDKGIQKRTLRDAGLPVPDFEVCATPLEAQVAAAKFGYPVLLKRPRGSYDGYGNATIESEGGLISAWEKLGGSNGGLIVEAWAPFVRELAVLVARRADGEYVVYPVAETVQRDHRCHSVVVPAPVSPNVLARAKQVGLAAVEAVDGVGLTAVELFEMEDGQVLVNELAPRPHNTGHYTIEGCYASQFENHIRAVLGWPLGSPDLRESAAVMVNVLGTRSGSPSTVGLGDALGTPGVAVHLYGKHSVREKRKMGHVTCTGSDWQEVLQRAEAAAAAIQL